MKSVGYYGMVGVEVTRNLPLPPHSNPDDPDATFSLSVFTGVLDFRVYVPDNATPPPPLGNGLPTGTQDVPNNVPTSPNTVGGTMKGHFFAHVKTPPYDSVGTGEVMYTLGGTYNPATNKISLTYRMTGIRAVGTSKVSSGRKSIPISIKTGIYLGDEVHSQPTSLGHPLPPVPIDNDPDNLIAGAVPQDWDYEQVTPAAPLSIDLTNQLTQLVTAKCQDQSGNGMRTLDWNFYLTPYQIYIDASPRTLVPTTPPAPTPTSTVTITALDKGQPAEGTALKILVCTKISDLHYYDEIHATDGHVHGSVGMPDNRTDPCTTSVGSRPVATLKDQNGVFIAPGPDGALRSTDANGMISLTYTPPCGFYSLAAGIPIAGEDIIKVSLPTDANVIQQLELTTRVDGLVELPDSTDGSYVKAQISHGGLMYGAPGAVQGVQTLAAAFQGAQRACLENQEYADGCAQPNGPATRTYNLGSGIKPLRVTAMSLRWGGLNDINESFFPPHVTHNDGNEVDVGWAPFLITDAQGNPTGGWDMEYVCLLRAVILANNGMLQVPGEGGDMTATLSSFSGANAANAHFHIVFWD